MLQFILVISCVAVTFNAKGFDILTKKYGYLLKVIFIEKYKKTKHLKCVKCIKLRIVYTNNIFFLEKKYKHYDSFGILNIHKVI